MLTATSETNPLFQREAIKPAAIANTQLGEARNLDRSQIWPSPAKTHLSAHIHNYHQGLGKGGLNSYTSPILALKRPKHVEADS